MEKNFVTFVSPGTFFSECTTKEIDCWDVAQAKEMARNIKERYHAKPFGFYFTTRVRGKDDFDSKEADRSGMFYLGGKILTLRDVEKDSILYKNMKSNGWERVIDNCNSYKSAQPFSNGDVLLDWEVDVEE